MKKQLLIGTALFAAISAFPQTGRNKIKPSGIADMTAIMAARFAAESNEVQNASSKSVSGPVKNLTLDATEETSKSAALPPSTINWNPICGSMNIVGMLVEQEQPLQYNDNLNAVSFIHRKSLSYQSNPLLPANAQSGIIVAEISTNWGNTWDSTCIYANATDWGRYPQGGIYNPPGNTNISNAYVVGMGPTTPVSTGWTGNFFASKQLNVFNNVASAVPNAQQNLHSNLSSYPANLGPSAFSRNGFTATDDGIVRSLGWIMDDPSALTGMRGVSITKGTFNAGTFTWTSDSLVPNTVLKTDGSKIFGATVLAPQMAWNEAGTHGYVVMMGAAAGASSCNLGAFQPIIYKTTNSGLSWAQVNGLDFNGNLNFLTDHIAATNANTNVAIPFFTNYDMVVDQNNNLHLGGIFMTGASPHVDSLSFFAQYSNQGELYKWAHTPGQRPYLYDFIGNGSGPWSVVTIDSLSSESIGVLPTDASVNENPWAPTGASSSKTDDIDNRLQMSRTPIGDYITFTFSESDTSVTTGVKKFNNVPNIKARCMEVAYITGTTQVSPTEINVSKVAAGTGTANPNIANRATLHYLSPVSGAAAVSGTIVDIQTPITVTNSNPLDPNVNNITWYQRGKLSYTFSSIITGVSATSQNSASNSMIYPNPASNNAVLAIELKENSNVDLTILNTIGQVVKASKAQGQVGQNNVNIDLSGLSTGVYMVNVKVGNATSTKKLIVQ